MTINNLYTVRIRVDDSVINIGDSVSINIDVRDYNGELMMRGGTGHVVYLIAPDGTTSTLGTVYPSNSEYVFTVPITDYGIWTIKCHHSKVQIKPNNNFRLAMSSSNGINIYENETQIVCRVSGEGKISANNGRWANVMTIPSEKIECRPEVSVFAQDFMRKGVWQFSSEGYIYFIRQDGASGNVDEYVTASWSKRL